MEFSKKTKLNILQSEKEIKEGKTISLSDIKKSWKVEMYSIEFTQTAEKQFYKLEKNTQKRIINVLERIKIRPFHFVKRKQNTPYFILRVEEYRVLLNIKKDKIFVIEVGYRKNIYD